MFEELQLEGPMFAPLAEVKRHRVCVLDLLTLLAGRNRVSSDRLWFQQKDAHSRKVRYLFPLLVTYSYDKDRLQFRHLLANDNDCKS